MCSRIACLLLFSWIFVGEASAAARDLFVVDVSTDRLIQIDGDTGALVRTIATFGKFDNPRGLLFHDDELLVSLNGLNTSTAATTSRTVSGGVETSAAKSGTLC